MQYHYTKTYDKDNLENNTFNHNKLLFEWIWVTANCKFEITAAKVVTHKTIQENNGCKNNMETSLGF